MVLFTSGFSRGFSREMRIGSLFAGIGGLELGLEWSGIGHTVWQVEQDEFCQRVLERHWPRALRFSDVRDVGARNLPFVDVICGGFPCQDVSAAGKGKGITGERSGLWTEFARVIDETSPRVVVVENVTSGASRWLAPVSDHLGRLGYETLPIPISAASVGAPHPRRRIFVIAVAADAKRIELWQQQGRSCRENREGSSVAPDDGKAGDVSDPERIGREEVSAPMAHAHCDRGQQSEGGLPDIGGRPRHGGWWSTEPDVGRVAYGVPARSHRLRALGNAVVPQCAEVIIRELGGF